MYRRKKVCFTTRTHHRRGIYKRLENHYSNKRQVFWVQRTKKEKQGEKKPPSFSSPLLHNPNGSHSVSQEEQEHGLCSVNQSGSPRCQALFGQQPIGSRRLSLRGTKTRLFLGRQALRTQDLDRCETHEIQLLKKRRDGRDFFFFGALFHWFFSFVHKKDVVCSIPKKRRGCFFLLLVGLKGLV